ncbi:MAG: gliding motility-associated C-terminal domain-containing protein, partial [Thermoanaerobaculia bacterium]|nr:gliding motility-associated C-terminal domain-containing protein [Thermoanaerobaculia bacterium]
LAAAKSVSSCDGVELQFDYPIATDNCGAPFVEQLAGPATGTFFPVGQQLLEFRTTDAAGNSAMCSVQVEVLALTPLDPVISDKIGCAGDDITLSTPVIPGATYIWNGPKPPYPNTNTLLIENLGPALTGIYTVQANWNGCLTPLDSALVRQGQQPDAVDDLDFEVETGALLDSIDVIRNDQLELDDYIVTLITDLPGLTVTGNGQFSYQAGADNGRVSFVYQVCSEACPDLCDEAAVTITVRETFCSYIPNVITPNGDGINDYLEIPCLETDLYPNNSLVIYNQWGDKVYQAAPYKNDPTNAWQGTLDGKAGQPLPDGTYFYYFQPTPDKKPISGFIEVFR